MPTNYNPRRGTTPVHGSSTRSSSARRPSSYYAQENDRYIPRSPRTNRRKRKSGPPPILYVAVLVLVVLIVAIVLLVKSCSSKPEGSDTSSNSSQTSSQTSSVDGTSQDPNTSSTSEGQSSSTPSESEPTPAPQEEPQADPETVGALMVVGDTAYEYYNFNTDLANSYITAVAEAGEKLSGIATLYDMVVPTSIDIMLPESYLEKNADKINTSDQRKAIEEYIYPSIQANNSSVKTVSTFDTLKAHANEYLYFRTDHHWTQLGAYYAYTEFCKARGFEAVPLEDFDKKEYTGYLGSFYSSSSEAAAALGGNPDTVEAYIPKANVTLNATQSDGQVLENWPLIADGDEYGETMKYLIYAAGDQPYEEITNNDMEDGPSCILVKESFGNCFIPFLVNHYKNVYVVDYRYYTGTVTALAQEKGVDDVILLNNISMTRNEGLIDNFTNIF